MVIEQFMSIFDGLQEAYGTFRIEKQAANGKAQGKAGVVREPRTMLLWENHLGGRHGIGIIPINEDNNCKWGCIDVDQYPLDHTLLVSKIRKLDLPFSSVSIKIWRRALFLIYKRLGRSQGHAESVAVYVRGTRLRRFRDIP